MGAGGRVATAAAMLVHLSCSEALRACAIRQSLPRNWCSSRCRCALHWASVAASLLLLLLLLLPPPLLMPADAGLLVGLPELLLEQALAGKPWAGFVVSTTVHAPVSLNHPARRKTQGIAGSEAPKLAQTEQAAQPYVGIQCTLGMRPHPA